MKTAARIAAAAKWCRDAAQPIVFVPTMGALHQGHVALIRRAREIAGPTGSVVISIFVNPLQFGSKKDLTLYPRTYKEDHKICRREGVDLLFHPLAEEMYHRDSSAIVSERKLSSGLCGASRPGHFDGVCTVVTMLFQIIQPKTAVFGEKDWQQLAVIRRMVRDLRIPVAIVGHPTIREKDGLALSSRNRLLTPAARRIAPAIHEALTATSLRAQAGECLVSRLQRHLIRDLTSLPGATVDYAEIVDEMTLVPLKKLVRGTSARALVALRLDGVRLIDNLCIPSPR